MSDGSSFRECSRVEGVSNVSHAIAAEAQTLVREAAKPIAPGDTVKAQLRRAARALGYRDGDWRIRAAWYREAGCWSASALEDLRARFRTWRAAQDRAAIVEMETQAARFRAIASSLGNSDADLDREEAARLLEAAVVLGRCIDERRAALN